MPLEATATASLRLLPATRSDAEALEFEEPAEVGKLFDQRVLKP